MKQDHEGRLDKGLWKKACQIGLLPMCLPIEAGGIAFGPVASALASEAIGKPDPNLPTGLIVAGDCLCWAFKRPFLILFYFHSLSELIVHGQATMDCTHCGLSSKLRSARSRFFSKASMVSKARLWNDFSRRSSHKCSTGFNSGA